MRQFSLYQSRPNLHTSRNVLSTTMANRKTKQQKQKTTAAFLQAAKKRSALVGVTLSVCAPPGPIAFSGKCSVDLYPPR
jgi:hypothetical protein